MANEEGVLLANRWLSEPVSINRSGNAQDC